MPVGPEPVLAYVASRKVEISMVRMLLVGKLAGVDSRHAAGAREERGLDGRPQSSSRWRLDERGGVSATRLRRARSCDIPAAARELWNRAHIGRVRSRARDRAGMGRDRRSGCRGRWTRPIPAVTVIPGAGSRGGVGQEKTRPRDRARARHDIVHPRRGRVDGAGQDREGRRASGRRRGAHALQDV